MKFARKRKEEKKIDLKNKQTNKKQRLGDARKTKTDGPRYCSMHSILSLLSLANFKSLWMQEKKTKKKTHTHKNGSDFQPGHVVKIKTIANKSPRNAVHLIQFMADCLEHWVHFGGY